MKSIGPSWIGRRLSSRYQIEAILGRGGMSSVYRAYDPNLQRKVAVKIIHQHLTDNPEFIKRFEREAALVAQMRHEHIVQVHDFNHDGDVYYMVLELIAGETLAKRLEALNNAGLRLPLADAVEILATLCDAVDYAHQRRMIHRDLKPANVMIDLLGKAVLMDFGIAKIMGGQAHTATGAAMGTAAYMSPEQVQGEKADHRADIYSLGIMLYEMLSGETPFHGDSTYQIMLQHVNEPVPDIRLIEANVPPKLVAILRKALAKDPYDRYQTAAEMAAALRAFQLQWQGATDALALLQQDAVDPAAGAPAEQMAPTPLSQGPWRGFLFGAGAVLCLLALAGGGLWLARDHVDLGGIAGGIPVASTPSITPTALQGGVATVTATSEATPFPFSTATATATSTTTSTFTPRPTTTTTATATATPLEDMAIVLEPSSIFDAPDSSAEELAVVAPGEQVSVVGRSESGNWLFVVNDEFVQGYIFAERLDWGGDIASLPAITPIPGDNSSEG